MIVSFFAAPTSRAMTFEFQVASLCNLKFYSLCLLALSCSLLSINAFADWIIEPAADVETTYSDNLRQSGGEKDDGFQSQIGLQLRATRRSEVSNLQFLSSATFLKYSGVDSINEDQRETFFFEGRAQRVFKNGQFNLRASARRQDLSQYNRVLEQGVTAPSQTDDGSLTEDDTILDDDFVIVDDVDRGNGDELYYRDTVRFSPSYSLNMNPLTSIVFGYNYNDIGLEDLPANSTRQESSSHVASVQLNRRYSETTLITTQISVGQFEPEFNGDSDNYSVSIGGQKQLSPLSSLTGMVGLQKIKTDSFSDNSTIFNVEYNRRIESGRIYASLARSIRADSYGQQLVSDYLAGGIKQNLTQRLSWGLQIRLSRSDQFSSLQQDVTRDRYSVSPSLSWGISRHFQLRTAYRYIDNERSDRSDRESTSHRYTVSLEYFPRGR